MKKIVTLVLLIATMVVLSGCNRGPVLNILNWNEYINEDLLAKFEEEYNVTVVLDPVDTNEAMYTKIVTETTKYDIAIPSDYMIHKLYKEGLLHELDYTKIPNYESSKFDQNLQELRDGYFEGNQNYGVPYFWGSLGIMYNDRVDGLAEMVNEYGWEVFFNSQLTGDIKVTMYNSSRDAIAAAQLYLGYDLNSTSLTELNEIEDLLSEQDYFAWGGDQLKEMVAVGNADIALVYSGDFFDMLYASLDDEEEINYNMVVPNNNNIWFDAMVIPTTSQNVDLAHEFINFMIQEDNAYANAQEVGYCPPLTSAYQAMIIDPDYADVINEYPYYPGTVTNGVVYEDLGTDIYQRMELILNNVKG